MNHSLPEAVRLFPVPRLTALEDTYARAGVRVEIEAGPFGCVVYGASRRDVATVARNAAANARVRGDARAEVENVGRDTNEPATSSWYAVVRLDWARQSGAGS
jgi:hypothetical protein